MPFSHTARSHLPPNFTASALPLGLAFGRHHATLRRLEPSDAELLLEFFQSHSEETKYERYGCAGTQMPPERAAQLVSVDQDRDTALGVFDADDRRHRLVAIGRYCLAASGRSAEAAFVVHESWRRLGIGTTLCAALVAIARERKLDHLVALVRHGNVPMIHVLRATGAAFEWAGGATELKATLLLANPPGAVRHPADLLPPRPSGSKLRPAAGTVPLRTYLD